MTAREANDFKKKYILVNDDNLVDDGHRTYAEYEKIKKRKN